MMRTAALMPATISPKVSLDLSNPLGAAATCNPQVVVSEPSVRTLTAGPAGQQAFRPSRESGTIKPVESVVDAQREIEELVAFEARWPGTDAERRAAAHLAARLEDLGREAQVEPTRVYPNYATTHLIHGLLAIVGSVLSITAPGVGFALVAIATVSAALDLTGVFFLVRRLTGVRASQNVVSRE